MLMLMRCSLGCGSTLTPSSRDPPLHYCYPPIQPGPHEYPFPFATPMNICHCLPRPPAGWPDPVGPSWFAAANLVMEGRRPGDYLHIHSALGYVVTPTRQGNDLKRLMRCKIGAFPSFMFLCTPSVSHILTWTLSLHMWSIPSHFFKTYMCANSLDGDEGMRMCQHIKTLSCWIKGALGRMQPKNDSKLSAWYSHMS